MLLFSDESKFNVFDVNSKETVWRKLNTSLQIKNLKSTAKHDGGHIMIWGCMPFNGVGEMDFVESNQCQTMYSYIVR